MYTISCKASYHVSGRKGGGVVCNILTITDKGGEKGKTNSENLQQRAETVWKMLRIIDKGAWRAANANSAGQNLFCPSCKKRDYYAVFAHLGQF